MATYPAAPPFHHRFITVRVDDISTAGTAWVVPGFRGKIKKAWSVIDGAIATADSVLTLKIGSTNVANGVITVTQDGSAAGDVDTATPSAANLFTPDQPVQIVAGGQSTNTVAAMVTLELEPV